MEDDFDLDNILDSMNLTGQWQPSSMPDIVDPSLNIQVSDLIRNLIIYVLFFFKKRFLMISSSVQLIHHHHYQF
jgi:hypothetical protein